MDNVKYEQQIQQKQLQLRKLVKEDNIMTLADLKIDKIKEIEHTGVFPPLLWYATTPLMTDFLIKGLGMDPNKVYLSGIGGAITAFDLAYNKPKSNSINNPDVNLNIFHLFPSDIKDKIYEIYKIPIIDKNEDCSICLEKLTKIIDPTKLLNRDQNIVTLPCKHSYHQFCIKKWCNINNTCPYCREPFVI
jgi:hypothetical protein